MPSKTEPTASAVAWMARGSPLHEPSSHQLYAEGSSTVSYAQPALAHAPSVDTAYNTLWYVVWPLPGCGSNALPVVPAMKMYPAPLARWIVPKWKTSQASSKQPPHDCEPGWVYSDHG